MHASATATLALARGDPEQLRTIFAVVGPTRQADPIFDLPLFTLALRAEAELALNARAARDDAAELAAVSRAQELLRSARTMIALDALPRGGLPEDTLLQVELCELEAGRARGDSRADAWAAHAARWQQLGRPFPAAYAQLREAEAAFAENLARERIAKPLAAARATAARLGALPLLQQVDTVSRRARLRSRPEQGEAVPGKASGLTTRELDVLRLIAAGQTNPEIGKTLYISPKTASVHVSRILAKLDVKTRTEAAGVAHQLGLLDADDALKPSPRVKDFR
jgi:DNA-binding CsgD family transcriptional regulator